MSGTEALRALERANSEQLQASDPTVSAFVAASAGSGKTKLLTDRLLRLMLTGADPARIQCLTFTKAAAAEMAVRLQRTLGAWVTLDDAALDARLAALRVKPAEALRRRARALFAEVLDLPGGMRIGTIHAFCQSLLRRFPLEAQLSPHFQLLDDTDAGLAMQEAREDMLVAAIAPQDTGALEQLAGLVNANGFGDLVRGLQSRRARLAGVLGLSPQARAAALRRAAGVDGDAVDDAQLVAEAVRLPREDRLRDTLRTIFAQGAPGVQKLAVAWLDWLGLPPAMRAARWEDWAAPFFTGSGSPRAASGLVNKKLSDAQPNLLDEMLAEQRRVDAVEERRCALRVAEVTDALLTLAGPVLHGYAARKDREGLLEYDDLISLTLGLLRQPGAAWVLFKLDGGLDHLLLDEVQDTAPAQWDIADQLVGEFFAGQGQRPEGRSFFAVGDRKQSIYSFQGADVASFDSHRDHFRAQVKAAGQEWRDITLDVSFRSAAPVLALVDHVFADPVAAAGVTVPGDLRHHAARAGQAGRVELWPLAPREEAAAPAPWSVAEENHAQRAAPQRLADRLATWIAAQTDGSVMLESRGRPLAPGDVLVLVRRRNEFAGGLVRALKSRGVPVAGLDRMMLTDQPAVQDLLSLCDTLLLPQDNLSLACVLTSPLGGLDDDALMDLAARRGKASLWDTLRRRAQERPEFQAAWDLLSGLQARVDYTTPHALLAEALGPLRGRARLLARLGPEAAEPLDELLAAAQAYGLAHPPSLQGFLHWLRQSAAEVKREAEGAGGTVRIMTVHGAKGLQAPLVILPDTTGLPPGRDAMVWTTDAETGVELPLWTPRKEFSSPATDALQAARSALVAEEYNRLLYVALTRAEDRLLVCGWETQRKPADESWYRVAERAFLADPGLKREAFVPPAEDAAWTGEVLVLDCPQTAPPVIAAPLSAASAAAPLPGWAGRAPDWRPAPPPAEPALAAHLAPSRPEGVEFGPVPRAASPLAARDATGSRFRRGALVHALLQHLPDLPPADRAQAGERYLAAAARDLGAPVQAAVLAETLAVLDHPALALVFGPAGRAEVPLTGVVDAGGQEQVVGGLVDRLAVLDDAVVLVDFKTNRDPPATVEATPRAYLAQLAAYRAVLRAIYPDRPIQCALVWTQGTRVVPLPDALLDAHAPHVRPAAPAAHAGLSGDGAGGA